MSLVLRKSQHSKIKFNIKRLYPMLWKREADLVGIKKQLSISCFENLLCDVHFIG